MKIQLIRNATLRLNYAGKTILIDPMLGPKGSYDSLAGIEPNPTVDLPVPLADVLAGVDLVIVSHLHRDHFDDTAKAELPKDWPLFCQPADQAAIEEAGFTAVRAIEDAIDWEGIHIQRTGGTHALGDWAARLNPVSGFVFSAEGEPTLYWIGDSVWCDAVGAALAAHQPDVIVTHSGGARLGDSGLILMDEAQTLQVAAAVPGAAVLAVHQEALDHCTVTRAALRAAVEAAGEGDRVFVLEDGEEVEIE